MSPNHSRNCRQTESHLIFESATPKPNRNSESQFFFLLFPNLLPFSNFFFSIWLKFWRHEATMKVVFCRPIRPLAGSRPRAAESAVDARVRFRLFFANFSFTPFTSLEKPSNANRHKKTPDGWNHFWDSAPTSFLILNFKIVKKVLIWNYLLQQWRCLPLCPSAGQPNLLLNNNKMISLKEKR